MKKRAENLLVSKIATEQLAPSKSADATFIIGALSREAGGVVFNNRVLVDNLLNQGASVLFYNYLGQRSDIADGGFRSVSLIAFLGCVWRSKPESIWIHVSRFGRFLAYYVLLLPLILLGDTKIQVVFHSGRVNINPASMLPRVIIHLLDKQQYNENTDKLNVSLYTEFFRQELQKYLQREPSRMEGSSAGIVKIIESGQYFLTTGYINPTYNFNSLLDAYLRDTNADYRLIVVSYGPISSENYTNRFLELASRPGVMHLRDLSRPDYLAILSHSSCLIRATLWDSFGIVMYEADFFGVPVLASRIDNFRPPFAQLFDLAELDKDDLLTIVNRQVIH